MLAKMNGNWHEQPSQDEIARLKELGIDLLEETA
jgi:hypothetical protein